MLNDTNSNICCTITGHTLVLFSSLLAILISKELTTFDQNLLAALLQSIGDNLYILTTIQEKCQSSRVENFNKY